METKANSSSRVIILWDYENVSVPKGISGLFVAQRLQEVFGSYGPIRSIQAFGNSRLLGSTLPEELSRGGVKFVDAMSSTTRKDLADKLLLTELFMFALDNPAPATIIMITGDVDYANALSNLKLRGYFIVLVPPTNVSRQLLMIPNSVVHWNHVISPVSKAPDADSISLQASGEFDRYDPTATPSLSLPEHSGANSLLEMPPISPLASSSSNLWYPSIGDETDVNTVYDLLDVCLSFVDQGLHRALASRAGAVLLQKYPARFRKGILKTLVEDSIGRGWMTTEGEGGFYTLVFNVEAMQRAWEEYTTRVPEKIKSLPMIVTGK